MSKRNANQNQALLPITSAAELLQLAEIKYLPGFPRNYRFNAKEGLLNFQGEQKLTDRGESFQLLPIAFRIFTDQILGFSRRRWAELFFINQAGQLCALMFHGYSVEHLQHLSGDLYYDNAALTDVVLTVTPEARSNEHGKYFVAKFNYAPLSVEEREQLESLRDSLPPIFRTETLTGDAELHAGKGYGAPTQPGNGNGEPPRPAGESAPAEEAAAAAGPAVE